MVAFCVPVPALFLAATGKLFCSDQAAPLYSSVLSVSVGEVNPPNTRAAF